MQFLKVGFWQVGLIVAVILIFMMMARLFKKKD